MVDQVDPDTGTQEEDVSYEELFNQEWGSDEGPDLTAGAEDSNEEEEEVEPEAPAEAGAEEDASTDDNEAEPTSAAADPEGSSKSDEGGDDEDWYGRLPDEFKGPVDKLQHEIRSDRGRLSALQRKYNETQAALEAARASQATQAAKEEKDTDAAAPSTSEAAKQLLEDYPELGAQLQEVLAEERRAMDQNLEKKLQPINEARQAEQASAAQRYVEEEAAKIFNTEETGVHWKDVVGGDDFPAWLNLQPKFIQDAARTSDDPETAVGVLRMYEDDYQAAVAAQESTSKQEPEPSEEDNTTTQGDKLAAKRKDRKAKTTSPPSKPVGTDADKVAGDYEAMFNTMWGGKK